MYQRLSNLLNVRPEETWLVRRLFLIQFFFVLAGAFMFITANTVFISSLPIIELPKAYIFTGVCMLFANYIYRRMDVSFDIRKLSFTVVAICLTLIILQWSYMQFLPNAAMPYVLLIIYNIVYLFLGYVFWSLAALLFNTRDSKRIFTLISAGDLPAKLTAYLGVSVLVYFMGLKNMLLLSIAALLIAFILVKNLFSSSKLDILEFEHQQIHYFKRFTLSARLNRIKRIFGSDLILSLCGVAFISFVVYLVIDFTFLAEVKPMYKSDVELASFFGIFFALGRAGGVFVKLMFSSRVINRLGIVPSLMALPLALLLFCAFLLGVEALDLPFTNFLYLFGIMTLLAEIGRSVIQEPMFFVLFQPLRLELRLKGHVMAKGYMYPLALILTGGSLYAYLLWNPTLSFVTIAMILVAAIVVWILLVFIIKKNYIATLQDAIRTGFFRGHELYLGDADATAKLLLEKTNSSNAVEVIYALDLLKRSEFAGMPELMQNMLLRKEKSIVEFAIDWMVKNKNQDCLPALKGLMNSHPDQEIRARALYASAVIDPSQEHGLDDFMYDDHPAVCIAAVTALLQSQHAISYKSALDHLYSLSNGSVTDKIASAEIIGKCKKEELIPLLVNLINDDDVTVQHAAIIAASGLTSPALVHQLVKKLEGQTVKESRRALIAMQEHATNAFIEMKFAANEPVVKMIIRIVSNIQHDSSTRFLKKVLIDHPAYHADAIHALWVLGFTAGPGELEEVNTLIKNKLADATSTAHQLAFSEKETENTHLRKALYWELRYKTDSILQLLSFLYNREKINQVILAFELKESFRTSTCMELLEVTLPGHFFKSLNRLLEVLEMNYSLKDYKLKYRNMTEILEGIIINSPLTYNCWTNAQAILHSGQHRIENIITALRKPEIHRKDHIVEETRLFVISQHQ